MSRNLIATAAVAASILTAAAFAACKNEPSSTGSSGPGGGGGSGGDAGGGTGGTGGEGGSMQAPAVLCPETNPFQPTLENAVQVVEPTLSEDTTWTADKVWLVGTNLDPDGHALTIEAGTMVCFYNGGGITIGAINPSEIHVDGTPEAHVTFTATSSDGVTPSFWGGVVLNQFESSSVSYLDIFYSGPGGGASAYALAIPGTAGGTADLVLDHVNVDQVQAKGIQITSWDTTVHDGLAASDITFGGYFPPDPNGPPLLAPLDLDAVGVGELSTANLHIAVANVPAESAYISLEASSGGGVGESVTWTDLGLPYRLPPGSLLVNGETGNPATLTIAAGVTLQMRGDIILGDPVLTTSAANLVIEGTAGAPVVITSAEASPQPGDWGTIYFTLDAFDPSISHIDHAEFSYGGSTTHTIQQCPSVPTTTGMIEIDGQGDYEGPPITNSSFTSSSGDGISGQLNINQLTTDYSGGGNSFADNAGSDFPGAEPCN